jgi:hypothetical protein
MLLLDLENIEHVMLKKYNEKLKAQVKATTARADGKVSLRRAHLRRAHPFEFQRRCVLRSFSSYARLTAGLTRRTTCVNVDATTRKVSPLEILRESFLV